MESYYPVNDNRNNTLAKAETGGIFRSRLAEYKYYDMAPVIFKAFEVWKNR